MFSPYLIPDFRKRLQGQQEPVGRRCSLNWPRIELRNGVRSTISCVYKSSWLSLKNCFSENKF